jgi:hypothetical protein
MRALGIFAVSFAALTACGPRQVEVHSAPTPASSNDLAIDFTNNLSQAVNVYVVTQGTDVFVKQVAAKQNERLPVRGIASGASVQLRATTLDGKQNYTTTNPVVLTGTYSWKVP